MNVSIVLGTRPQIIKSAPVFEALTKAGVRCDIINTGQHYDYEMNREFFSELNLPDPSTDLGVGKGTPADQVAGIITGIGRKFASEAPDLAIVPGDTNSALAAGIACSKAGVRVAHLESGCRSNDFGMAEEVNRRLLDHSSHVLLCPTRSCARNAKSERVLAEVVENVGDTMYDSVLRYLPLVERFDVEKKYEVEPGSYVFMTLHRAEAVDQAETLRNVMAAAGSLGTQVLFSVHPRTRARLEEFGIGVGYRVRLLGPLPYVDTLSLAKRSKFVVTDSGGLQKEAYWLGRPSIVLRDRTEWTEIVDAGAAVLAGTTKEGILKGAKKMPRVGERAFRGSGKVFGGGHASENVTKVVVAYLSRR